MSKLLSSFFYFYVKKNYLLLHKEYYSIKNENNKVREYLTISINLFFNFYRKLLKFSNPTSPVNYFKFSNFVIKRIECK